MRYHSVGVKEVLIEKETTLQGLSEIEVQKRLEQYGENKLREEKKIHPLQIFLRQFQESVVYILLAAIILSFFLKEYIDASVIGAILIFNAILGFFQEYKAERAVELLKQLTTLKAKVMRKGIVQEIPSNLLVPGDIVIVEAGDKIPADMRIIEAANMQTDEASLTGESMPCHKKETALGEEVDLSERSNMLYAGTAVVRGRGMAVVVETGMNTEIGKIAKMVQETEHAETPLQIRLEQIGKLISIIIIAICAIVVVIGVIEKQPLYEMVLTAISLGVAAIPEGLPAVVTICLALSVQHMIKRNALVKRLKSIETLGDITVICSDKTGTMTKNEMTVRKLYVNDKTIDVTGYGYTKEGQFLLQNKPIDPQNFRILLDIAATCNDATETTGDPTEMALLFCAIKGNGDKLSRIGEIPFDSDKKFMATFHNGVNFYKGAVEIILEKCTMIHIDGKIRRFIPRDREKILKINHAFAESALRVLAMAYEKKNVMYFVGMMGMIDPPKEGVKEAIQLCHEAGIRPVMITGDHPITAQAIAKQVGLEGNVLTGHEIDQLTDEELDKKVHEYAIYARTTSTHKVRILKAFQDNGEIVAMTGDGINDAPALKKADVGVAMAIKGTDVSRDAADMVLTDDNFSSIVAAIREGRIVYDNIRKFINYLLSANVVEVSVIVVSLALRLPLPLLPLHLLWINLMTDSWPALALGVDRPEDDVIKRKPKDVKNSIIEGLKKEMIVTGIIGTVLVIGLFIWMEHADVEHARTVALTTLILFELARAYNCRSEKAFTRSLFKNKWLNYAALLSLGLQLLLIYTPFLQKLFKVGPLSLQDWGIIIGGCVIAFVITEILKITSGQSGDNAKDPVRIPRPSPE